MQRPTRRPLLATLLLAATASLTLAQTADLPPNELLIPSPLDAFRMAGNEASKTSVDVVPVEGQSFDRAWRVVVKEKLKGDYSAQLLAKFDVAPKKGDVVLMTLWARMIDTADESGDGRLSLVLEQDKDPFNKVFSAPFGVRREWQRFDVPAVVLEDFSKTGAHAAIRVGAYAQTLEIGGVELRTFPGKTDVAGLPRTKVTYAGRDENAPWRAAAAQRIEQIRKAPLNVAVVDAAGQPVADAQVAVKMKRHAFVFGSVYNPTKILDTGEAAEKYKQVFLENFNTGVDEYAMKWPHWGNAETRQKAIDAHQWMLDHNIPVRGHTMVWPGWKRMPAEIKEISGDKELLKSKIRDHIASVGGAFKGKVIDWDVVNEPFVNDDLLKILGEEAMADWFRLAHAADPDAKLYLNETSVPTSPPNDVRYTTLYNRAKMIKDLGAPIHGVGMQAHFGQNVQPPEQLLKIYDRFAELGLPVRITELDLDIGDEDLQTAYWRDFLTASFSHPNINGIMIWGFYEPNHWRPVAAMYKKDWSPRPIAGVWKELLFKQWWTDTTITTAADGKASVRGFLGDYELTATAGEKTVTQKASIDSAGQTVTLQLP